jgi:hypothetical protein
MNSPVVQDTSDGASAIRSFLIKLVVVGYRGLHVRLSRVMGGFSVALEILVGVRRDELKC